MGIAQSMNKNMKKNMEAQMQFQKELILKQRQMQLASTVAMGRERFWYYEKFVQLSSIGLFLGAIVRKDPRMMFPLVPFSFAYAYQYDLLYGNMLERAQIETDKLLLESPMKFMLPAHSGIVSTQDYLQIMQIKDGKKVV